MSYKQAAVVILLFALVIVGVGLLAGLVKGPSGRTGRTESKENEETGKVEVGPATQAPGDDPWLHHRLPKAIVPIHYDLQIFPDFYEDNDRFYGNISIDVNVTEKTQHILLHYKLLEINHVKVLDSNTSAHIAIKRSFTFQPNQFLVIELVEPVEKGSSVTLKMAFDGSLTDGIVGLYKSGYLNTITNQTR